MGPQDTSPQNIHSQRSPNLADSIRSHNSIQNPRQTQTAQRQQDHSIPATETTITQDTQMWVHPPHTRHRCPQFHDRHNEPDIIELPNSQQLTTILFQNLNGLCKYGTNIKEAIQDTYHMMRHHNISIMCMSEHHLATAQPEVAIQIQDSITKIHPQGICKAQFNSSSSIPTQSNRLMGGTGIITQGPIINRLMNNSSGGDSMGRWSYQQFARKGTTPLIIISVYQVCQQPTNPVGQTAWHQQRLQLDDLQRQQEHPRQAFLKDLDSFLTFHQAKNHAIIIGGDWNNTLYQPRSALLKLCTKFHLSDPWLTSHPESDDFATYQRGRTRIDSVLISHSLIEHIHSIAYTPVGHLTNSDHRGILLTMFTNSMFQTSSSIPETRLPRAVRSKDPQSVTKFIETAHSFLHQRRAFDLALTINTNKTNTDLSTSVERLDALIGHAMDFAERKCRKRRATWYSIPLVRTRLEISYLKFYRNGLQMSLDRKDSIMSKLETIKSSLQLPNNPDEVSTLITKKIEELQKLRLKSQESRHLDIDLRTQEEHSGGSRKKDPRQRIKKAEVAARTWSTLEAMTRSSGKSQRINRIDIPSDWPEPFTDVQDNSTPLSDPKIARTWKTITNTSEMEYYLLLRNRLHFGQAQGTPFTEPPLSNNLDWGGTSPTAQALLNGTFIPPTTFPDICQRVLRHCRRQTDPIVQAELTTDEFLGKMKCWRETTSTSPSGRHLGRYKAMYARSIYEKDSEASEEFKENQKDLVYTVLCIINYCIRTGYVLKRWRRITNMMILKDPNNFQIHRLRIIHIYEADLNLLMAVKWRQLLHKADKLHIINVNQYGGRPGREAPTLAFMEEIKIDISYLTRRILLTFDNDAASCYDRILPVLVSILNQKYGLPIELARVHGMMLLQAEYRLLTAKGISDNHYSHTSSFPIYGSGQGSGNSPVLWLLISATLFDIHHQLAEGATFSTPDGTITTKISISGFVDDTNTSLNNWQPQHQQTLPELLKQLQSDAQCWNDLLYTSGGKLELTKCSFHSLEFEFNSDGTPRVHIAPPPPILLQDSVTQDMIEIPSLSVLHPHKTLGHWKAPSGRSTTQLQKLQQKAKTLSILIASSPISRHGAKLAYAAKYIAALGYVLPQCHFSHLQLRKAERASISTIISKCGFSSRSPHAVIFTPTYMGGSGFVHWHTLQSTGQIMLFLKHWRSISQTSDLLRINVAWAQWQSGMPESIFHNAQLPVPYLEARWLVSLREALGSANAKLRLDTPGIPQAERLNDFYIMALAQESQAFNSSELHILNCCRLYLHVTTASELYNVEGTEILPHIRAGRRAPWFDPTITIVLQKRPSDFQWKTVWQKLLRIIASKQIQFGGFILHPFPPRLRREMYQESGKTYLWYAGRYNECSRTSDSAIYHIQPDNPIEWKPSRTSIPIDKLAKVCSKVYVGKRSIPRTRGARLFPAFSVTQRHQITWKLPPDQCYSLISRSTIEIPILLVSDGSSFHEKHMSFGVVIGYQTGQTLIEISGPVPGNPSSHRAECYACLAGLQALRTLHASAPDSSESTPFIPYMTLYSDNKAMITSISKRREYNNCYPNTTMNPDWDLLEEIDQCLSALCLHEPKVDWVKGHQDRYADNQEDLPTESRFNIRADALANQYLANHPSFRQFQASLQPSTRCHLDINGVTVTSNVKKHLQRALSERPYHDYLCRRHQWTVSTKEDVDWRSLESAASTYFATEVHLSKLIHDMLPTRAHVARFQPWIPSTCHYCTEEETIHHLQCCQHHPVSIRFRTNLYDKLSKYCLDKKLPTDFSEPFLQTISASFSSTAPPPANDRPISEPQARQQLIGISLVTRGFLSRAWHDLLATSITALEERHKQASTSRNPYLSPLLPPLPQHKQPHRFLAGMIKLMWGTVGELWLDHLALVHRHDDLSSSPETHTNLQSHVLLLQDLKPYALPNDHETYFLDDKLSFCSTSSPDALHRYIVEYRPRILASVRQHLSQQNYTRKQINEIITLTTTWSAEHPHLPISQPAPRTEEPSHRTHHRFRLRYPVPSGVT